MSDVLNDYLSAIGDPVLAAQIRAEFDRLPKELGLVFERHGRENILVPTAQVEVGSKVVLDVDDSVHIVVGLSESDVVLAGPGGARTVARASITVAHELGDILYPGLKPFEEIRQGKADDPVHTIINGENLHALEMLQYTHAGAVDLIYVDPPYGTGNKTWIYNDRHVADKDSYRHSKWLSFMEERLLLARKTLKLTGVIVVAIGDDEHARLRLLMDQVFGAGNFIANVTWQGSKKSDSRYLGGGADYMLIYARDRASLDAVNRPWREAKTGVDEIARAGMAAWESADGDARVATKLLREWWKSIPADHPSKVGGRSTTNFKYVDGQTRPGHVFADGVLAWPNGEGPRYDVIHPVTGLPCRVPKTGWRYTESRMLQEIACGMVYFNDDETGLPYKKRFLEDSGSETVAPSFTVARRIASGHLEKILGDKRFPFPKDHNVLMRWFRMIAPKDAVILDFFAGSGTTAEAVMRLNAEDGGTRQAILVTNNELAATDDKRLRAAGHRPGDTGYEALGVFHHVTRPRISTVITGVREDGAKYSDGLAANAAFFELQYLASAAPASAEELEALAGVFWLRAGGRGPLLCPKALAQGFLYDPESTIAVLFHAERAPELAAAITASPTVTHVFIVTDSDDRGVIAASHFHDGYIIEHVYGSNLRQLHINKAA
jgi:adenine-specific DNA-methyltransferase